MIAKDQRIAIAEACPGWLVGDKTGMSALVHWKGQDGVEMLSDPLEDLNAMHEAEKVITEDPTENYIKFGQYLHCLERLVVNGKGVRVDSEDGWSGYIAFATAAQRAEAFLKTLGKWKD